MINNYHVLNFLYQFLIFYLLIKNHMKFFLMKMVLNQLCPLIKYKHYFLLLYILLNFLLFIYFFLIIHHLEDNSILINYHNFYHYENINILITHYFF